MIRQSRYVFYPDKGVGLTPAYFHLPFEDLRLETPDGERLGAWFVPGTSESCTTNYTVLFCHGNAGNIGDRLDSILTFHRLGFNVLIFDYRGYGDSTGEPSEQGTYIDARAAWDYLVEQKGIEGKRILVFGRSLGGAVAVQLAGKVPAGALCVESTFASAVAMARVMFPLLPARMICRFDYDSENAVGKVHGPIIVAHSRGDKMIPYAQGRRVYEAANQPKLFIEITGDHNSGGLDTDAKYQRLLAEFLQQHEPFDDRR